MEDEVSTCNRLICGPTREFSNKPKVKDTIIPRHVEELIETSPFTTFRSHQFVPVNLNTPASVYVPFTNLRNSRITRVVVISLELPPPFSVNR